MSTRQIKHIITAVLALATAVSVLAEDMEQNTWHISPYVWLPNVDVDTKIGPTTVPIDMDFGDILDEFDVVAVSARAEYWWGQFGVVGDGLWMDMQKDKLGLMRNGDAQLTDGILDILAAYRFNLQDGGPDVASMRLLAGGRYHYLKQQVDNVGPGGSNIGGSEDWFEPVLGAQLLAPLGEKWMANIRGDVGGFGLSDASDLTVTAMAGVGYEFATNWLVKLGYRYYYIDYTTGSGRDTFGIEGNMHGFWLGFSYGL